MQTNNYLHPDTQKLSLIAPDRCTGLEFADYKSVFPLLPPHLIKSNSRTRAKVQVKMTQERLAENNTFHSNPHKPATCTRHPQQLIPQERHLIKSFQANPLLCFCQFTSCQHLLKYAFNSPTILKNTDSTVFNFNQLYGQHFSFHNNVLLGIQEAGSASIIW